MHQGKAGPETQAALWQRSEEHAEQGPLLELVESRLVNNKGRWPPCRTGHKLHTLVGIVSLQSFQF